MKKILSAKLKSNSGASLMAALLFFVMAATVGSIILAAATASSGRLAGLKKEDQAYYSLTSAADMFSKIMTDEDTAVIIQLNKVGSNVPANKIPNPIAYFVDPKKIGEADCQLTDVSDLLLETIVSNSILYSPTTMIYTNRFPSVDYTDSFTDQPINYASKEITLTFDPSDKEFDSKVVVSINRALCLKAEFTPSASSGLAAEKKVTLLMTPVIEEEEAITYHDMAESVKDGTADQRNTIKTKTYTVRWTNPVLVD